MIRLVFTYLQEVLIFDIDKKEILYRDRKWPDGVRFIPKDLGFMRKIMMSRNRISNSMIQWIEDANTGKSLVSWTACNTDEEVAEIVKRDARIRGCVFRKAFTGEELAAVGNLDDKTVKQSYIDTVPIKQTDSKETSNEVK